MLNLKSILKLATGPHAVPLLGAVVFDGRNAISVAHSRDAQPWWAGVPCPQDDIARSGKGPRAVPVEAIKAHSLRSMHLRVAPDHLHNGVGLRTEWDKKTDWNDALTLLPGEPKGEPVQFQLELDALDRALIAASDHDLRNALQGVLLDLTTGRIVGCDGHRLHVFERKLPKLLPAKGQGALHVLLPKAAARWLLYSADDKATVRVWQLGADQPLVLLQASDGLVYTKAIVGQFPDYLKVLKPRSAFRQWARVSPGKFSDSVAAMEKLHALEKPKLLSVGVHWGEGRIYAGAGPNFVAFDRAWGGEGGVQPEQAYAWFFPRYLADLADCVTADADWCIGTGSEGKRPCDVPLAVFDGDFAAVLMPQRPPKDGPPSDKEPKAGKGPRPASTAARPSGPAKTPPKAGKGPKPAATAARPPEPAQAPPKAGKGPGPASTAARPPEPAKAPPKAGKGPKPAAAADRPSEPAKSPPEAGKGPKPASTAARPPVPAQAPPKSGPIRRSHKADPKP